MMQPNTDISMRQLSQVFCNGDEPSCPQELKSHYAGLVDLHGHQQATIQVLLKCVDVPM